MNTQEILQLLNRHEWKDVEFKEAKRAVPNSAFESVSAFANTEGGHLVFGVRKDGSDFEVIGVINVDKVQNDFLTGLRSKDKISSIIQLEEHLETVFEKDILIFYIPEASRSEKPVFLDGNIKRSFLRKGACDVKCSPEELKRLLNDSFGERYDGTALDYDLTRCFSSQDIGWYRRQYEERAGNRDYTELNDEDFLFRFGLIKETQAGRKPTVASILLFGEDGYLRGLLPRPVIDCQRYLFNSDSSEEGRWHHRTVCDYNLVQTWNAVMEWYYRFAEIPFELEPHTMQRKDQPVDYVAFREAIVNVLIHQDYSDHTRKPVIQHYSNLTRFWNPGDAFVSVDDLLEPGEKDVRNPLIVTMFRRIGFSENAGWGLRDVFRSWRSLGHIPPELTNDKSRKAFELVLKKEILLSDDQVQFQRIIGVDFTEDEAAVFAYACKRSSPFSLNDIRFLINKSRSICLDVTDRLTDQCLLVRLPNQTYELNVDTKERLQSEAHDADSEAHDADSEAHDADSEAHDGLNETERTILQACETAKSASELLEILGYGSRTGNFKTALSGLLDIGLLVMTLPESPRSKSQKYVISSRGLKLLQGR